VAFQIKDFRSIVASMINHMRGVTSKITDFSVGSVARTLVEAPAVEIDEFYQQTFIGLKEAIPVATYNSFNFSRNPATAATGKIRVTITSSASDTLISAGTVFQSAATSVKYSSTVDVTIAAGNTVADVPVQATTVGANGNITTGYTFTLKPTLSNLVSATNVITFTTGSDEETDDERKIRFASYIGTLQRGTLAAIGYGLSLAKLTDSDGLVTERVVSYSIVEPYKTDPLQPVGWVQCYLHAGSAPASVDLIAEAVKIIHGYTDTDGTVVPGWNAAGVQVDISAATDVAVSVTGTHTE
jgi:hypothetical protein